MVRSICLQENHGLMRTLIYAADVKVDDNFGTKNSD